MKLAVVILAAGQGKRMKSDLPKVLQPLAGRPLLAAEHAQHHGGEEAHERACRAFPDADEAAESRDEGAVHAAAEERGQHAGALLGGEAARAKRLRQVRQHSRRLLGDRIGELPCAAWLGDKVG